MTTNSIVPQTPIALDGAVTVALGSGKAADYGVGIKGTLLDQAAKMAISVPNGYILLDVAWQFAVSNDLLEFSEDGISCKDPQALYDALNLPAFPDKTKVMIRSAFSVEDTPTASSLGHFASISDVDPGPKKAKQFIEALCQVWASSVAYDDIRRDVLVMEMVKATHAGVALSEPNYEDDYVNYTEGNADQLLNGEADGMIAEIPRLRTYERAPNSSPAARLNIQWSDRLQILMRRVRTDFGDNGWDVEWAFDGSICYLLQLKRITVPAQRNERFTIANHKEILPPLPSRYMVSIIEDAAPALYEWYRNFDSTLPSNRLFIRVFKGRPYINLSLMTETMRALGLPTSLVTDSIGGAEDVEAGFQMRRAIAKLPSLTQLGMSQLSAVKSAQDTERLISNRALNAGSTFKELGQSLRFIYVALVHEMFNLTQTMSLSVSQLRRNGELEAMAKQTRSISTQIYDDLLPLREYVKANAALVPALEKGEMPEDGEFKRRWGLYLAKHGHRGIYESDIASPRFADDPAVLLRTLVTDSPIKAPHKTVSEGLGRAANRAQRVILAREQLLYTTMHAFQTIRHEMLQLAEQAVARNQIPSADLIWDMSVEETALLDVDWSAPDDFVANRRAEIEALAAADLPDTLRRFDDLEAYQPNVDTSASVLSGMSLVSGQVEGKAWVLQDPSSVLPEGYTPENTILIARASDAGWIPAFTKVAGVVVESGGDLSHGNIILRELGIPSVTNVKEVTRIIQSGDTIKLDGAAGKIERL